jgi:5-formyltetrahydrofolate cyclo-ligase
MTQSAKQQLRAHMRARRQALSEHARQLAARNIAGFAADALPFWSAGARIAAYLVNDGEIDPAPLLARAAAEGLQTYLPVIRADRTLVFRRWEPQAPLQVNRYGIGEPLDTAAACTVEALDILCLPMVAWTAEGGRLGMGGGYYDRTLASTRPGCLCGLAFSWQRVADLPLQPWDIGVDMILCEDGVHRRRH